uniref:Uncharacterized protein n=1 Tax=Sphenodon punctatus TaxID=8508 RepID=A0A8D0G4U8_SPHPU
MLDRLGGMGRFQIISVAFLGLPLMMLASHNLLQNFTAGVPGYHCQVRVTANHTRYANATRSLAVEELLQVSIPMGRNRQLEKCLRFVSPQWRLLGLNATAGNGNEGATEPCVDGWVYDRSMFTNTIVTEVRASGFPGDRESQPEWALVPARLPQNVTQGKSPPFLSSAQCVSSLGEGQSRGPGGGGL